MAQDVPLRGAMSIQWQPADNPSEGGFEPRLGRSVSIEQAAILLGVCRRTIYNRIRDGSLQTVRTLGTSQRVLVASIDQYRRVVWAEPQQVVQPPKASAVLAFAPRRASF